MSFSLLKRRIYKDNCAKSLMFTLTVLSLFLLVFMGVGLYLKSRMILDEYSLWTLLSTADWKPLKGSFGFYLSLLVHWQ